MVPISLATLLPILYIQRGMSDKLGIMIANGITLLIGLGMSGVLIESLIKGDEMDVYGFVVNLVFALLLPTSICNIVYVLKNKST